MARIVIDDHGCWVWQGSTSRGYGQIRVGSRTDGTYRMAQVHRVMYLEAVGPIPDGYEVDHLCRNRTCCNPDHLEAVTQRENNARSFSPTAVNMRKAHCNEGHPLAGDNLRTNSRGARICITCYRAKHRDYERERYARKKQAS